MNNSEALKALESTTCACGKSKSAMRSFCLSCYRKLPPAAQKALYRRIFDGYLEAYQAALTALGLV